MKFNYLMRPHIIAPRDRIFQEKMKHLSGNLSLLSSASLLLQAPSWARVEREERREETYHLWGKRHIKNHL